ncbi:hypothetical protein AAG906_006596 [Vitis piasezkii]
MEHRANLSAPVSVAYVAHGQNKGRDMRDVQCFSCKDFGHIARDCPKKFCNYCKKQGHIIFACLIRPERKQGTAYHASIGASSSIALPVASSVVPIPAPTTLANPNTLTPEMPWYFDFEASNHIMNLVLSLSNVRNYDGNLKINTADGSSLPISVVDQVSGKMIAKGPKVGRLFPLHVSLSIIIPSFPLLSFACNVVGSGYKMWHRRLGHPNSDVLRTFDVWGIAPIVSHAHYKYFVTFIDDFSCFTWVYFLRAKAEVFSIFKRFLALIETQFSASIKRSCPSTPQQNSVAESKNRHLLDVAMEHECWQNAMQAELQALEENHTWDIVPCPPTVKPIGSKWVFSVKLCSDGSLDRYKARLVALAIPASQSWQLHQMDVKNVFLHDDIQEEIYMKFPSSMTNSFPHDVFHDTIVSLTLPKVNMIIPLLPHVASGIVLLLHKYIQDLITLASLEDTSSLILLWSQFMTSPRHLHLAAVRRIIRYLRGDALISWRCKKQDRVSKSSTEAEYRAMSTACSEIVWLRGLLKELGAIDCHQSCFHERTKHIEVDCHSIQDTLESRVISLPHISSISKW